MDGADLPGLNGIPVLMKIISSAAEQKLRAEAAYALGTAASNNAQFQAAVLKSPGSIPSLLEVTAYLHDKHCMHQTAFSLGEAIRTQHSKRLPCSAFAGRHRCINHDIISIRN